MPGMLYERTMVLPPGYGLGDRLPVSLLREVQECDLVLTHAGYVVKDRYGRTEVRASDDLVRIARAGRGEL